MPLGKSGRCSKDHHKSGLYPGSQPHPIKLTTAKNATMQSATDIVGMPGIRYSRNSAKPQAIEASQYCDEDASTHPDSKRAAGYRG